MSPCLRTSSWKPRRCTHGQVKSLSDRGSMEPCGSCWNASGNLELPPKTSVTPWSSATSLLLIRLQPMWVTKSSWTCKPLPFSCKHTFTSSLVLYYPGQRTGQSHFGDQKHWKQGTFRPFIPARRLQWIRSHPSDACVCLQIKAYLLCSKLRPAYLQAVKLEASRASPLVQDVLQAAEGAQDSVMQNICRQWLSEHSGSSQQRQGRPSAR